ncbi:MAG: 3-dehydroquinate dehydratase [Ignavibacteriales bacterium]|nr:3-dehydroquinate dehydratase [Ignavibacteriales bacterium]
MKILVLNGPNLNLLGKRDNEQYGNFTLQDIEKLLIKEFSDEYFEFYQSNVEGELINKIQSAESYFDGVIINPGGYAHTSVAIRDALAECKLPKVEVHLSNLSTREQFRQVYITASACNGYLSGFKEQGYLAAVFLLKKLSLKR